MAEINLSGEPIFEDVVANESHILYSQLLREDSDVNNVSKYDIHPTTIATCTQSEKTQQSLHSHRDKKRKKTESNEFGCDICKIILWNATQKRNHSSLRKQCELCEFVTCSESSYKTHLQEHGIKPGKKGTKTKKKEMKQDFKQDFKTLFKCALCTWSSKSKPKILLHLIHHPNQTVNEEIVDISVLRKCGIME